MVGMLNKSLADVGVTNVKVVAIINDTTGTLVAGSHDYPDTAIGLILGTGTNGSYMEKAHRVVRWNLISGVLSQTYLKSSQGGSRERASKIVSLTQNLGPGGTMV